MKASANGAVNVSILDGWWDEGYTGSNGFAIGGTTTMAWQSGSSSYQIKYTRTTALCWTFTFYTNGAQTSTSNYCRSF